jgi:RND superfamily putative drug exporter
LIPTTRRDDVTARTLERLRRRARRRARDGQRSAAIDLDKLVQRHLRCCSALCVASFLLLTVVFRSVVVAVKATVMNLLSIGAAYGVVVAVFQWGWLGGLIGLDDTYLIASPLPAIFFAVLFGLSMDYEVFLVSRIREAYAATGDNVEAVARGLASTGRVITCGALIMVAVFLSFVANPNPFVKMIGLGLAVAIASTRRWSGWCSCRPRWRCWARRTGGCRGGSTGCSRGSTSRASRSRLRGQWWRRCR